MSTEQYMAALAAGNRIRLARSVVKKQLRAGTLSLEVALGLECCGSMMIGALLEAQRRWGPSRVAGLLGPLGISPVRLVSALTERQVGLIVGGLR